MRPPSEVDHFELMRNPLSGEFGVSTPAQLEHFVAHELPSFTLVRRCSGWVIRQRSKAVHVITVDRVGSVSPPWQ